MLDCRQVLAELSNYLDDDVTVELARAITQHLARCHRCWVVYDTTRRTLQIVSDALPPATPVAVSERLHARLREVYASGLPS
jgi:predicted anti-sigma-YlaC factor YlaD